MPPNGEKAVAAQRTSATASSMRLAKIWATPARRPGAWAQKSASQRLWAWMPAQRRSYSASVGGRATRLPSSKKGGTVLGKSTSAVMPSASFSARRRSESQLR